MTSPAAEEVVDLVELRRDLLVAELDVARALLAGRDPERERQRVDDLRDAVGGGVLDELASSFALSSFEGLVLLLVYGPDLVGEVARELSEQTGQPRLTFATALERLPDAHWDAITPQATLRRWGMVRLADPDSVLASPLIPDERILHHLVGAGGIDNRLDAMSCPATPPGSLPPTFDGLAADLVRHWTESGPVVLRGPQAENLRAIAAAASETAGLTARLISSNDIPTTTIEITGLLRQLIRETILSRTAWLIELDDDVPRPGLGRALAGVGAPIVALEQSGRGSASRGWTLPLVVVPRLRIGERRTALMAAVTAAEAEVTVDEANQVAAMFDLPIPDLEAVAIDVAGGRQLWAACKRRHRTDVGSLARVITPKADWDSLVLPEAQLAQLHALTASVRHRTTVLEDWGFGQRSSRGLGTTALFAGESGTGKTFAAEVIAKDLDLDLVHIDLSQVVDKYIGETEKRLAQLFDAAEDGGMVLLFDEADALFGKRSQVKDSHDRHANIEVSYILQRLETFTGLAILTTNTGGSLDRALTRRISMTIEFPQPSQSARQQIWQVSLSPIAPQTKIDFALTSEIDLTGGAIANASLRAAYIAVAELQPIGVDHIDLATRWELAKIGRV